MRKATQEGCIFPNVIAWTLARGRVVVGRSKRSIESEIVRWPSRREGRWPLVRRLPCRREVVKCFSTLCPHGDAEVCRWPWNGAAGGVDFGFRCGRRRLTFSCCRDEVLQSIRPSEPPNCQDPPFSGGFVRGRLLVAGSCSRQRTTGLSPDEDLR